MKIKLLFFTLLIYITATSISAQNAFNFSSGFENNTYLNQYELNGAFNSNYADIYGYDITTGYDWVQDIDNNNNIGNFRIYYEKGDTLSAKASIVNDPTGTTNRVLKFKLDSAHIPNNGNPKGRIQAAINGSTNLKEFSFKVRLYIHPDIDTLRYYNDTINWLTLMEFWNNDSHSPFPFRITLNIQKPNQAIKTPLYFGAHGQTKISQGNWKSVWSTVNTQIEVPTGEWFTLETYFFEGDSLNGKYKVVLTDQQNNSYTLFDIRNYTYHPNDTLPDGVTDFNPMKLYTSGTLINGMRQNNAELSVYWDDFEIWSNTNILNVQKNNFTNYKVYPNPFDNYVIIENIEQIKSVELFNIYGTVIKQINNMNTSKIELSTLPSGAYFLKIIQIRL